MTPFRVPIIASPTGSFQLDVILQNKIYFGFGVDLELVAFGCKYRGRSGSSADSRSHCGTFLTSGKGANQCANRGSATDLQCVLFRARFGLRGEGLRVDLVGLVLAR